MLLNGIKSVDNNAGDYVVLADYGSEGLVVVKQEKTCQEAIGWMVGNSYGQPMCLVKLIKVDINEID